MPDADEGRDLRGRGVDPLPDPVLVAALRALPLQSPAADGWSRMATALQSRTAPARRARRWLPMAVAAGLVAAVLMLPTHEPAPADGGRDLAMAGTADAVTDATASATPGLIAQSQVLERLLSADAWAPVAQDSDQALLELGLRDRIRLIDAGLVEAGEDSQLAERLWRARVGALGQLAQVQWAGRQSAWAGSADAEAGLRGAALVWAN